MTEDDPFARAWRNDTGRWKNWYLLDVIQVAPSGEKTGILRRLVGWDDSPMPSWLQPATGSDYEVFVTQFTGKTEALVGRVVEGLPLTTADAAEVRRFLPEVSSWDGLTPASAHWGLRLPTVCYEFWPHASGYERARLGWEALAPASRKALATAGVIHDDPGFAGCAIVHCPFILPYAPDVHNLVIPDGASDSQITLQLEILHGVLSLSRMSAPLRLERDSAAAVQRLDAMMVHRPKANLWDLQSLDISVKSGEYTQLPPSRWGSGGDSVRVTVQSAIEPGNPAATVGLIRGIGGPPLDPWKDRVPGHGFSPPATVHHVPPTAQARQDILKQLGRAGRRAVLSDPYIDSQSLLELRKTIFQLQVITKKEKLKQLQAAGIPAGVEVRWMPDVHDRFLVGRNAAFLLGTSLNGLGKQHSFVTELDHPNAHELRQVFADLWAAASL